jgi:hypothetical protein
MCRVLVEGVGSKLGFRDENPEVYLWLNMSPSVQAGGISKLVFGDENPEIYL